MIEPADIEAASDVVYQCGNEAENLDFERAVALRIELQRLISNSRAALANVEMDMVRQLEHESKKIHGVTYTRAALKKSTTDHERLLSVAYRRALKDATQPDGNIDWEALGEYYGNWVVSLYLAPSTVPKVTGMKGLDVRKRDYVDERTTGWKLLAIGEEDGD